MDAWHVRESGLCDGPGCRPGTHAGPEAIGKIGASNRIEAARIARARGWL
jgi:hypothetical protein